MKLSVASNILSFHSISLVISTASSLQCMAHRSTTLDFSEYVQEVSSQGRLQQVLHGHHGLLRMDILFSHICHSLYVSSL